MKYVTLKDTELNLSALCCGTGNFKERLSEDAAFEMLNLYLRMGGNFIDTANVYCRWLPDTTNCAEQFIGEWLRRTGNRSRVYLATKGGHPSLQTGKNRVNRADLARDLDESLAAMGVDYVDFYWLHRDNAALPIEEVISFGEEFVRQGKVRYYGASNFTLPRMQQAVEWKKRHPGRGFSALCNQWSLACPNPGYKLNGDQTLEGVDGAYYHWILENDIPLIPYSATAGGYFGKAAAGTVTPALEKAYGNTRSRTLSELLQPMAERYHTTPLCLSLAILMQQNFQVIPVTAASTPEQLAESMKAGDLTLLPEDVTLLNKFF